MEDVFRICVRKGWRGAAEGGDILVEMLREDRDLSTKVNRCCPEQSRGEECRHLGQR